MPNLISLVFNKFDCPSLRNPLSAFMFLWQKPPLLNKIHFGLAIINSCTKDATRNIANNERNNTKSINEETETHIRDAHGCHIHVVFRPKYSQEMQI